MASVSLKDLLQWTNLDYVAYTLRKAPDREIVEQGNYGKAWNRVTAMEVMSERGQLVSELAAIVNARYFKPISLSNDETIARMTNQYEIQTIGIPRQVLDIALAFYQGGTPLDQRTIDMIAAASPAMGKVLSGYV